VVSFGGLHSPPLGQGHTFESWIEHVPSVPGLSIRFDRTDGFDAQ
jgi:hypothetical protein